ALLTVGGGPLGPPPTSVVAAIESPVASVGHSPLPLGSGAETAVRPGGEWQHHDGRNLSRRGGLPNTAALYPRRYLLRPHSASMTAVIARATKVVANFAAGPLGLAWILSIVVGAVYWATAGETWNVLWSIVIPMYGVVSVVWAGFAG